MFSYLLITLIHPESNMRATSELGPQAVDSGGAHHSDSQERPGGVTTLAWYAPMGCAGRRCSSLSSQVSPWPGALECDWQGRESAEGSSPCRAGGAQCC